MSRRVPGALLLALFLVVGRALVAVTLVRGIFEWWMAWLSLAGALVGLTGFMVSRRGE